MLSPRPMALLALRDFNGLTWQCPEIPFARFVDGKCWDGVGGGAQKLA